MTKVESYLRYKKARDELPGNDTRRDHHWMRVEYEKLSHRMMMTKPTERDWKQHTFDMLSNTNEF